MKIEFDTPAGTVPEWVIDDITKKLIKLHDSDKGIYKAKVSFHKDIRAFDGDYVCEIELGIYSNSILVQCHAESYNHAAIKVLKELALKIEEHLHSQNEPPAELVSTVNV